MAAPASHSRPAFPSGVANAWYPIRPNSSTRISRAASSSSITSTWLGSSSISPSPPIRPSASERWTVVFSDPAPLRSVWRQASKRCATLWSALELQGTRFQVHGVAHLGKDQQLRSRNQPGQLLAVLFRRELVERALDHDGLGLHLRQPLAAVMRERRVHLPEEAARGLQRLGGGEAQRG